MDGNVQGYAVKTANCRETIAEYPHDPVSRNGACGAIGHTEEGDCHDAATIPRSIQEVEAEGVAFLLCSILELPGRDESRGYIQSWLDGDVLPGEVGAADFQRKPEILDAGKPLSFRRTYSVIPIHSFHPRATLRPGRERCPSFWRHQDDETNQRQLLHILRDRRPAFIQLLARWLNCSACGGDFQATDSGCCRRSCAVCSRSAFWRPGSCCDALLRKREPGDSLASPDAVKSYFASCFWAVRSTRVSSNLAGRAKPADRQHGDVPWNDNANFGVYPREMVRTGLKLNASAIICAQSPQWSVEPSRADEMLTSQLRQALALVDIKVLDPLHCDRHFDQVLYRTWTDLTTKNPPAVSAGFMA